jgi:hypothetical protein
MNFNMCQRELGMQKKKYFEEVLEGAPTKVVLTPIL